MKHITILAAFIAIAGAQGGRKSSTVEQDTSTAIGTATGTDASFSITDTGLSIATDSASTHRRPVSGSQTPKGGLQTPTDSGVDVEATSTWDDENTDTWTNDGLIPGPSMIASQPLSVPPRFTGIAGPPTTYASTSMLPAATPIANPGRAFNNAGSRVGMPSSEWLVMGLIAAVAAILL